jgi:DNA (cytosine-5)-methyltransferase 1
MRTAVDLFAGAGGATQGLRDAGYDVVAAVENEPDAAETWRLNHPGVMIQADIRRVDPARVLSVAELQGRGVDLLKACPPCQGFSSLRGAAQADPARNDLVLDTLRFVDGLSPTAILLENVPGLRRDSRFPQLVRSLRDRGYDLRDYEVEASLLGVPQRRRRLVVIAVKAARALPGDVDEIARTSGLGGLRTAGAALAVLERQLQPDDVWHRWRRSSDAVAARIAAVPVGGNRFDLPAEHRLACHERLVTTGGLVKRAATGSYGRVRGDAPSPTMTTRCTTASCGSFIHPTENRGLSLREAASLQTFPHDYRWHGGYDSVERQIGNAVPVRMAEALGRVVSRLLQA